MTLKSMACLLVFCLTSTFLFAVPENGNIRMNPTGVKSFKLVKTAKVEWFSTSTELTDEYNHTWKVDGGTLDVSPATENPAPFDPSTGSFIINFQKAGHYEVKVSITYKYKTLTQTITKTFILDLVEVKITTTATPPSTLQIIQEEPGVIEITASIIPSDRSIIWTITGGLIGPEFVTSLATQTGGNSVNTIRIKRPVNSLWKVDTLILVTAKDSVMTEDCKDSTVVELVKFKRNGITASGSDPIKIPLTINTPSIGFTLTSPGVTGNSMTTFITDKIQKVIAGPKTPSDEKSGDLKYYYKSNLDIAKGNYKINENIAFAGLIFCNGEYKGFFHNASVATGGGCSAGVGNDSVALTKSTAGAYFSGFPTTTTLGITVGGEKTTPTANVGLSITFTSSQQDTLLATNNPDGTYNITENGVHPSGIEAKMTKKVKIASGVLLEQQNDSEWNLDATASLTAITPFSPSFEFSPEF